MMQTEPTELNFDLPIDALDRFPRNPPIRVTETALPPYGHRTVLDAYLGMMDATENAHAAGEWAIEAKLAYEEKKLRAIASGAINESNDAKREAAAQDKFAADYAAMRQAEHDEREAKKDLKIAELHVERLRLELRLSELAARSTVIEY
jgi:hypothetical protein